MLQIKTLIRGRECTFPLFSQLEEGLLSNTHKEKKGKRTPQVIGEILLKKTWLDSLLPVSERNQCKKSLSGRHILQMRY